MNLFKDSELTLHIKENFDHHQRNGMPWIDVVEWGPSQPKILCKSKCACLNLGLLISFSNPIVSSYWEVLRPLLSLSIVIERPLLSLSIVILPICCWCLVTKSCPILCNPMDGNLQAPLSMKFSKQAYWGGLRFPSPGNLPHPEIKPMSSAWQADSLPMSHLWSPDPPHMMTF